MDEPLQGRLLFPAGWILHVESLYPLCNLRLIFAMQIANGAEVSAV
jgi:hypothetical protein